MEISKRIVRGCMVAMLCVGGPAIANAGANPGANAGKANRSAASAGENAAPRPFAAEAARLPPAAADTARALRNGARFVAPGRWSIRTAPGAVILNPPEAGSQITIADGGSGTAEAAVAAAWQVHRPGSHAMATGLPRPPREGWDQTTLYRYDNPAGEQRQLFALALRKGTSWTVVINDLALAVSERRDGQLEVIFNSLRPAGYQRETFAGRKARPLDEERIAALRELIETGRREYDIPGVALGLIQNGKIVFAGGFGVRKLGRPDPVDENTLFNIASNGKALTTLMLAKLVEAGRFSWTTPVVQIWPEFRLGDPAINRQVQVGQLICACTGMPQQDFEWVFERERFTAASIMQLLSTARPTSDFGDTYQYSNLMAAAAGFLGGHVLHPQDELAVAYDRAMQQLVFDPLGMAATTADFPAAIGGNHAAGHARDVRGTMRPADMSIDRMAISTRPSGNHWSSVRDMLRYVQMELAGGRLPDGTRFISRQLLKDRQTPQVTEGLNEFYGMGLKIDRQWGVPVIHHGGTASGYRTDMIWLPDHGVGAVILINSDTGAELRAAFRRRLLELLFDGKPIAAETMASQALRAKAADVKERAALAAPADSVLVAGLAPRYRSDELGQLTVLHDGAATLFDFGGWRSEVATTRDGADQTSFVTISPGTAGIRFTTANEPGRRRLRVQDADREYLFVEEQ